MRPPIYWPIVAAVLLLLALSAGVVGCTSPPTTPDRPTFGPTVPTNPSDTSRPIVQALAATVTINLPAGTQSRVMAGVPSLRDRNVYSSTPYPRVVVRNMATNECTWTNFGDQTGSQTYNLTVNMGNQGDAFDSPASVSEITMWCWEGIPAAWHWYTFQPILGVGGVGLANVSINGGTGDDWMGCNSGHGAQVVQCQGLSGSDYLETRRADGMTTLLGGDMADRLFSTAIHASSVYLNGGGGNDCLQGSPRPALYDCADGTDTSVGSLGEHCEVVGTYCPQ